ncbi:hypothetical protein D3C72_2554530 [compost metagenome]
MKHLGIWNVQERLRLKYEDAASIVFTNLTTGGAEVILSLPLYLNSKGEKTNDEHADCG